MKTYKLNMTISAKDYISKDEILNDLIKFAEKNDYLIGGGLQESDEDMADKKYTEDDLREAISLARKTRVNVFGANGEESIGFVHSNNEILKIVTNKKD